MNLTRCSQGHFYDADKYATCPHCSSDAGAQGNTEPFVASATPQTPVTPAFEKTEPLEPNAKPMTDLTEKIDDVNKTIGIFNTKKGSKEPVAGWLVCVEGRHRGEDFRLKIGRNFIGRSKDMDVVLANDTSVSREKHSIIVYEPNENIFIIQAGDSKELSYLNDKVVLSPKELKPYDRLTLGSSTMVFVPFCSENFTWKEEEEKSE